MNDFAGFTEVVDVSFGGADVDADACSGLLVGWAVEGVRQRIEELQPDVFRAVLPDAERRRGGNGAEDGNGMAEQSSDHREGGGKIGVGAG